MFVYGITFLVLPEFVTKKQTKNNTKTKHKTQTHTNLSPQTQYSYSSTLRFLKSTPEHKHEERPPQIRNEKSLALNTNLNLPKIQPLKEDEKCQLEVNDINLV